jgi:Tol biopolymer transport system component
LSGNRWTPDGRYLLLHGRDAKGRWGIYQTDVQNGDLSLVLPLNQRRIWYPAWSPDGKTLYFSQRSSDGKMALMQRDLASGSEKELIRAVTAVSDGVSPDGQYIAASIVDVPSRSRIKLLIPLAGGERRELMRVPAGVEPGELGNYGKGTAVMCAQWAPDSRSFLTFKRFNDEKRNNEVWRVPLDGGAPVKLDLKLDKCFGLSPDRRRIAIVVDEKGPPQGEEVWVLENFLSPTTTASK